MKVVGSKVLWTGKFIETRLITYRDREGTLREWEAVGRVGCDGVVVLVPLTKKLELLLIKQYRPVLDAHVIEFPAGLVDAGENPVEAGKRELLEETGHMPGRIELLTDGVMSTGINTERWKVLLALDAAPAPAETLRLYTPDEAEDIELIKVPFDRAYDAIGALTRKGDCTVDLRIFGLLELTKLRLAENEERE